MYACLFEAVCDVTTVPSHLKVGRSHTSIMCVPNYFAGQVRGGEGASKIRSSRLSPAGLL